jgi:hypothetical protein
MNKQQKRVLAFALVVHTVVLRLTWLDLRRRPDEAIRGNKRLWRVASAMNTMGSAAYWLFGRKSV